MRNDSEKATHRIAGIMNASIDRWGRTVTMIRTSGVDVHRILDRMEGDDEEEKHTIALNASIAQAGILFLANMVLGRRADQAILTGEHSNSSLVAAVLDHMNNTQGIYEHLIECLAVIGEATGCCDPVPYNEDGTFNVQLWTDREISPADRTWSDLVDEICLSFVRV